MPTPAPVQASQSLPLDNPFVYTGQSQLLTVPANVDVVHITAVGAAGGTGEGGLSTGGLGGEASANLRVDPGEQLTVLPGDTGGYGGAPGAGGGGGGGALVNSPKAGGGGGGGSIVFGTTGGGPPVLLIAAGGGGGGTPDSAGGAGSGGAGQPGATSANTTPGAGGSASAAGCGASPTPGGTVAANGYGGGGGGGYAGGGAGTNGGGGGGGAGCVALTATDVIQKAGVNSGSGTVDISPAPAVEGLSTSAGPLTRGQAVTITGADFESGDTVQFGTRTLAKVTVVDSEHIKVVAPAGPAGTVDVTVTAPWGGTSMTSTADRYTFTSPPTVTSMTPSHESTDGGTPVTIYGTNLASPSALPTVTIGGQAAAVTGADQSGGTWIQVAVPSGQAGTANVAVETAGGSASSTFTYDAPVPASTTSTTKAVTTTTRPKSTTTLAPLPTTTSTSTTLWVPQIVDPTPVPTTSDPYNWIGTSDPAGIGSSSVVSPLSGTTGSYTGSSGYSGYLGASGGYSGSYGYPGSSTGATLPGGSGSTNLSAPDIVPADASSPTTTPSGQGYQPAAIIGTSGHSLLTTLLAIFALIEIVIMFSLWRVGQRLSLARKSEGGGDATPKAE